MLKIFDYYIIKKYLGTFFYALALIISIVIVFDIAEHLDEFLSNDAPLKRVFFSYYLNFIPYFANLFSSLFVFIAVIYFTSKMAYNSEIIALLSNGVSYRRLMLPYLISAIIVALFSYALGNFIIPPANKKRIAFKSTYIDSKTKTYVRNIHRQIEPGTYIYMSSYNSENDVGYHFTIERMEQRKMVSKLTSDNIKWDRERKIWVVHNYTIRHIEAYSERIETGTKMDTALNMSPDDYRVIKDLVETMTLGQLNDEIANLRLRGVNNTEYLIEKHRRSAVPFSVLILTVIGAALASRKVKGGLGLHLGLGLLLSFSYILFLQITTVFAVSGNVSPALAVWIPNIFYGFISIFIYRWAAR